MTLAEAVSGEPGAQVLLAVSEAQRDMVASMFPAAVAIWANGAGDWDALAGRSVVAFSEALAAAAAPHAKSVKLIAEPLPDPLPEKPLAWARKFAVVYVPGAGDRHSQHVAEKRRPPDAPDAPAPTESTSAPEQGGDVSAAPPSAVAGTIAIPPPLTPARVADPQTYDEYAEVMAEMAALDSIRGATAAPEAEPHPYQPEPARAVPTHSWQAGEWQEPVNWWSEDGELAGLPTVQPDMLPAVLWDYIHDQAALRGVDPVQPALHCLIAISGALHNSHGIRPKPGEPDYIERPILWGATVGNPSTKKDAGQAIALGPLGKIDEAMRLNTAAKMEGFNDANARYQDDLTAWRKGKQLDPRPIAPEPVMTERLLAQDFTMEGLRGVLAHNARGKVLIAVSELSGVFGNLDAFSNNKNGGSKDAPKLLQLYESKSLLVDRALPAPPVYVKSWAATISGAIQPVIFSRLVQKMNMTEDGMLARFLLVNSKPGGPGEDRPVDREAADRYKAMLAKVVAMRPDEQPCNLSPEAQEVRREFLAWIYRMAGSGSLPDGLAAAVGKFEGSFARLCLVMHAAECADAGLPVIAPEVGFDTAARVRSLILGLLYPHAAQFYRDLGHGSSYVKVPSYVAGFILATDAESINLSMLWQSISIWRHIDTRQQKDAIATLQESGWLSGKQGSRFRVNPAVHTLFAAQAQREKARRERFAALLNERLGREPGED